MTSVSSHAEPTRPGSQTHDTGDANVKTLRLVTLGLAVVAGATLALAPHAAAAPQKSKSKKKGPAKYAISLARLGTFDTGLGEDNSEIPAYDKRTKRLFLVNSTANTVDVVDLSDPSNPTRAQSLDMSAYGGGVNSVAVSGKTLAVAVENADKQLPGKIVFLDTKKLDVLSTVEVGALPDMVTFTPNGKWCLVANEGEPNADYTVDPEGSVSVIKMKPNAAKVKQTDVRTAGFAAFDGATLDASIRIFGPNATVAQDMEPEYIATDAKGRTAYVTCQENNCVAVVDLKNATVTALHGLGFKDWGRVDATLATYAFTNRPVIGTTAGNQDILLGGFSGLAFEGVDGATGRLKFITHPDRGPNAEPLNVDADAELERPFPLPDYQMEWVRFQVDTTTGAVEITERVPLTRADGTTPITGLPNLLGTPGFANADEPPVDVFGADLPLDPYGGDMEGMVQVPDGTTWMCDEYRPALYHFDATGKLIQRYVPLGAGSSTGVEALPAEIAQRRANRGFEAIAYANGKIYAFVQSPLDNPDVANDASSKAGTYARIVEFDPVSETTTGQYLYIFDGGGSDKIGDAVAAPGGDLLVIERDSNTGATSKKKIYRVSLRGATNLETLSEGFTGPGGAVDLTTLGDLLAQSVRPVDKRLYVDLAAVGYTQTDKVEGLAFIDADHLAIINDNDFELDGTLDTSTGQLGLTQDAFPPTLGIITLSHLQLDASDRDGGVNLREWPILGMYQPDSLASYEVDGATYLITANEGDSRDYDGYSEEARVGGLTLDAAVFGQTFSLQRNENLGRLKVTTANGDAGADGTFETLYAFGARSFSILAADGTQVFDSGDDFERRLSQLAPTTFNSEGDASTFDGRSDDKGPEPEGVTVGKIGKQWFAFIGLERIGGVLVYEVTDPRAPVFVQYITTPGDVGPEGLEFVPANESPTKKPLLIVANEISGTATVYEIAAERTE